METKYKKCQCDVDAFEITVVDHDPTYNDHRVTYHYCEECDIDFVVENFDDGTFYNWYSVKFVENYDELNNFELRSDIEFGAAIGCHFRASLHELVLFRSKKDLTLAVYFYNRKEEMKQDIAILTEQYKGQH